MILLGLLLMGATAAFTALLIAYNTSGGPEYPVSMFGNDIATMNSLAIFCAGLALALIFMLGLAMTETGRRMWRRRTRRVRLSESRATRAQAERDAVIDRAVESPMPDRQAPREAAAPTEAPVGQDTGGLPAGHQPSSAPRVPDDRAAETTWTADSGTGEPSTTPHTRRGIFHRPDK